MQTITQYTLTEHIPDLQQHKQAFIFHMPLFTTRVHNVENLQQQSQNLLVYTNVEPKKL